MKAEVIWLQAALCSERSILGELPVYEPSHGNSLQNNTGVRLCAHTTGRATEVEVSFIVSQRAFTQSTRGATETPVHIKAMPISHPNSRYHKPALLPAVFLPFPHTASTSQPLLRLSHHLTAIYKQSPTRSDSRTSSSLQVCQARTRRLYKPSLPSSTPLLKAQP